MCGGGAGRPLHRAGHVTPQLHPTVTVIDALLGTDNTSPAHGLGHGVLMLWLEIIPMSIVYIVDNVSMGGGDKTECG